MANQNEAQWLAERKPGRWIRTRINVRAIEEMYERGMTQTEIARALNINQPRVCKLMKRFRISARKAFKRDQYGPRNSNWSGDAIGYKGAHQRVAAVRGKPQCCDECGSTDPRLKYEWANLSRRYADPFDYKRMCHSCHGKHDGIGANLGFHLKGARNV